MEPQASAEEPPSIQRWFISNDDSRQWTHCTLRYIKLLWPLKLIVFPEGLKGRVKGCLPKADLVAKFEILLDAARFLVSRQPKANANAHVILVRVITVSGECYIPLLAKGSPSGKIHHV